MLAGCADSSPSTDASVLRLDAATGDIEWIESIGAPLFGDALVAFGQIEVPAREICSGAEVDRPAFDLASGESREAYRFASAQVVGGEVLVIDAAAVEVQLRDARTGAVTWASEFPCVPMAEGGTCTLQWIDAGLAADLALVSHNPESSRTILDALAREDGMPLWSVELDGARTASAVRQQAAGSGPALVFVSGNGGPDRILGLDRATGDPAWTVDLASDLGAGLLFPLFSPTVSQGVIVLPGCDETSESGCGLVGLDEATGEPIWRFETSLADRSAVDEGGAYTLAGADLVALDTDSGDVRWRAGLEAPARSFHVAVDGERVYAVLGDDRVVAFDASTGEESWRSGLPDAMSSGLVQLVAADGALFVVGQADISDLLNECD